MLHNVDTVVLDKTGTLTVGRPSVTDLISAAATEQELLRVAAALESRSEHPFALAILERAEGTIYDPCEDFRTLPGEGVEGRIAGKRFYGGNDRLMERLGIAVPEFTDLKNEGKTPLYFACEDGVYLGAIAAADVLKEDSASAVAALRQLGLDVIMLTGDNKSTAKAIAEKAGIDHVISDVLPGDKAGEIRKLMENKHRVMMVGDGINDAPALVTADVGVAIGSGTDIAIESADVVLMGGSLRKIAHAVELSRATMKNIRQNLFWAFFYNSLGIPVAAGVLYPLFTMSPMLGAAAMSMSSVFVVTNSLRLRMFKPRSLPQIKEIAEPETVKEEVKMETVIKVEGMMCPHCKARVESVCKAVEGTQDAVVDLAEKNDTVTGNASLEALKKAIT